MDLRVAAAEADPRVSVYTAIQEAESPKESDDEQDLELKAQRALECPCVADLREGPCGKSFSEALVCFIKSTAPEKGSDCVDSFLAMQSCMLENPDAFSKNQEGSDNIVNGTS